jgi:hypothetical protein
MVHSESAGRKHLLVDVLDVFNLHGYAHSVQSPYALELQDWLVHKTEQNLLKAVAYRTRLDIIIANKASGNICYSLDILLNLK